MWKWVKSTKNSAGDGYPALMEFLIENREKQEEQASCYRLPLRALSKEFKVAGDEVGDLLRSQSEPCLMDPDAKGHYPWIGFLAAGIGSHSQPVNWIAFVTSDSQSALTLMKNKGSKLASRPETADTERAKVLRKVIEALLAYFTQGTKLAPDKAGLDDPIDLAKIRDECMGLAVAEHSDADNCSALAEILVMYEDAEEAIVKALFTGDCVQGFIPVASFQGIESVLRRNWQPAFGTGWLGDTDRFLTELRKAISSKKGIRNIVTTEPTRNGGRQDALAAAAATKLITFGWLPSNYDERAAMLGDQSFSVPKKYALNRLYDDGVRFFRMSRVKLPREGELDIRNKQELSEAKWLHFKSPHSTDKVILAVEMTAYGRRDRSAGSSGARAAKRPRFWLFPIPLTAFGAIRSSFPTSRHDVIGYTPGDSMTSRSGILDALVRNYISHPSDSCFGEKLEQEICGICYPSFANAGLFSALEEKQDTEQEDHSLKKSDPKKEVPSEILSEVSGILESLINASEGGKPRKAILSPMIRFAGKMLRLDGRHMREVVKDVSDSQLQQHRQIKILEAAIAKKGSPIENIELTRESEYPRLKLFKSIAQLMIGAKFGWPAIPYFLKNWTGALFRFVWILPLDRIAPSLGESTVSGPPILVGSRLSNRYYPNLFSGFPEEGSVEIDLRPLFNLMVFPLGCGSKSPWRGWLCNRISETNELMVGLTIFAGYLPDFQLHSLVNEFQSSGGNFNVLLQRLDSKLIVRCIMEIENGSTLLDDWSHKIARQVQASVPQDQVDYVDAKDRLSALFDIFKDSAGIAVAALDCRRRQLLADDTEKNVVYFLPGKLREFYYPANSDWTGYARKPSGGDENDNNPEVKLRNLEEGLGRFLTSTNYNQDEAVGLINSWRISEGDSLGETPYDLLMSVKDHLYPGKIPPTVFLRKCRDILRILQPDSLDS